jgi:serine acetyltransferase
VKENPLRALKNRICQHLARILPGAETLRVNLHRARGVNIGKDVWIGYDVILETSRPWLITIGDRAALSMRVTVVAHFRETQGVRIEEDAFIGPGAIILPNVVIGRGAVVAAGSVVTKSVPPMTLVQGNPAVPIAECGVPLNDRATPMKEFLRRLKPINAGKARKSASGSKAAVAGDTGTRIATSASRSTKATSVTAVGRDSLPRDEEFSGQLDPLLSDSVIPPNKH